MKTTYELTYTNIDGREDTRTYTDKDEAIRWANIYKNNGDKKVRLVKVEKIEMDF